MEQILGVDLLPEAPTVGFVAETATDLLVRELHDGEGVVEVEVLDALVGAELFVAASLTPRVGLGASVPVWLTSGGEAAGGATPGDVQVSLPLRLAEAGRWSLVAVPVGTLPTGPSARYLGEQGPVAGAVLSATLRSGAAALRVDAGSDWMPPTGRPDWPGGAHGRVAATAGWTVTEDFALHLGARGRAPVGRVVPSIPSEASLVGRLRADERWWLVMGGGTALTRGPGASPLRMLVGLQLTAP